MGNLPFSLICRVYPLASDLHLEYNLYMGDVLKGKGLKVTKARLAILDLISKSKIPLTAESISEQLKKRNKNINKATVYRTLASFIEEKILKKVDFRKGFAFFELIQKHHHHIVCIRCDTIEDFENKKMEKVLGKIARNSSKFINIKDHSLELFGLCKNCSK